MNFKLVLVGIVALMVLMSGCAQPQQPAAEEPAAEEPTYEEPSVPAPAPEPTAQPPALPPVATATGSCQTLVAKLEAMADTGFPVGNCRTTPVYTSNFGLDSDEDHDIDATDLALAQQNKGNDQWCAVRLNRTRNPCTTDYSQFPTCSTGIRGDLTGDGKVDNTDSATLSTLLIVGGHPQRAGEFEIYPITGNQCCMDADGDGSVTLRDITDGINRYRSGQKELQKC